MKLKRYIQYILFTALLWSTTTACDDFDEINQNPNAATEMDPGLILSQVQVGVSGHRFEMWRGHLLHTAVWSNQMASPWLASTAYQTNDGWASAYWDRSYVRILGGLAEVDNILEASNDTDKVGKRAIVKIWKVYMAHRLTDMWGDIPYHEAGKGFEGEYQPAYDSQEEVYTDMLNALREEAANLSVGSNSFGAADLIYGGDHALWIKFANALRLRLALRVSGVNPTLAQEHISEVINSELIIDNDENAKMIHVDGDQFDVGTNGSNAPIVAGFNGNYLSASFIETLKNRNTDPLDDDPRLTVFALPNTAGEYVGLVNGTQSGEGTFPDDYSLPNYLTHPSDETPFFALEADALFMTASEVAFLKAEVFHRGWASGDAASAYQEGVDLSLAYHGVESTPEFEASIAFNPAQGLEQIITQKWVSLLNDGFEAYAEVRRTGYPVFPASEVNGNIPHRLRYPLIEQTINKESYQEAINRQGADSETTALWWDVN